MIRVSTETGYHNETSVAALGDGRFVVAFDYGSGVSDEETGEGIFARMFEADGSPSGPPFKVNSSSNVKPLQPIVSALTGGSFIVAWEIIAGNFSDPETEAYARRFAAGGEPDGADFRVPTSDGYESSPSIAQLPNGEFVIVWFNDDIYGQRFE